MITLLNRLTSFKWIRRPTLLSNSCFYVIFGWISTRERYLGNFIEIGCDFVDIFAFCSSKSGPKIDLVNRPPAVYSSAGFEKLSITAIFDIRICSKQELFVIDIGSRNLQLHNSKENWQSLCSSWNMEKSEKVISRKFILMICETRLKVNSV